MSHLQSAYIALLCLSMGIGCGPGWAAVVYVVEPGTAGVNPAEPYNTWTNASTNIATAVDFIAAAGEPDNTVWVDAGTYLLDGQVTVNRQVAIRGTNGQPVVDGGGTVRCFYFSAGITGILENLYITGGYAGPSDPDGGGVYIHNGDLRNCVLANNEAATNGGGLFFNRANLDVSASTNLVYGCTFVSNRAENGAGAYFLGSNAGHFVVSGCTFQTNVATGDGGGMHTFNQGGGIRPIFFDDCDLTENWAGDQGGGAYPRCAVFNDCRFFGNYAHTYGGGAGAQYGSYNIFSNCTVSGNYSREYGGGLLLYSIGEINGCVIVSNNCPGIGGGNRGGGGVYMSRLNSKIMHSKLMYNDSNRGGRILMLGGQVWNSLIANNSASFSDYRGGGIHCVDAAAYDSYILQLHDRQQLCQQPVWRRGVFDQYHPESFFRKHRHLQPIPMLRPIRPPGIITWRKAIKSPSPTAAWRPRCPALRRLIRWTTLLPIRCSLRRVRTIIVCIPIRHASMKVLTAIG